MELQFKLTSLKRLNNQRCQTSLSMVAQLTRYYENYNVGKHVGGFDNLTQMESSGKLGDMLTKEFPLVQDEL